AWLDLVVGRRTDGADPDTQAVLLANAGDAAGALRILRGRPWTQGVIAHGLRTSPDRWGRALFEVDPDGALTALGRVWADGRMIGDPAEAEAAALDTLAGIERRPIPRDPDARAAWAGLLRMRAWALLNAAQVQTAGDTLAALSRLGEVDPTQQERKDVMLWARLHALSGDPDLAMAALLEALEHAPSPSVLSYLILANPDLDPLHGHPRWAEIGGLPAAPP
ncbi:MAG TPA: hypothetical protein PKA64_10865, partial [Myxococcota bacterium]|nr:hypothetical protein [Myxococcota bacterium]